MHLQAVFLEFLCTLPGKQVAALKVEQRGLSNYDGNYDGVESQKTEIQLNGFSS